MGNEWPTDFVLFDAIEHVDSVNEVFLTFHDSQLEVLRAAMAKGRVVHFHSKAKGCNELCRT